jgi:chromobox protein 1
MTWEPEENLATAEEVLKEYYEEIGGRPEPPASKKRGPKPGQKRSISNLTPESTPSGRGRKKRSNGAVLSEEVIDVPVKPKKTYPPTSAKWDEFLVSCETIEEGHVNAEGVKEKHALLIWDDASKTRHTLRMAHSCAPQTVCPVLLSTTPLYTHIQALTCPSRCLGSMNNICKFATTAFYQVFPSLSI